MITFNPEVKLALPQWMRCTLRYAKNMRLFILLSLLIISPLQAEDSNSLRIKDLPDWAFCTAYVLRDTDKRDERPTDPNTKDPFGGKVTTPNAILQGSNIIDVASLLSRATDQKRLNKVATKGLLKALSVDDKKNTVMDCYDPHHIFVFYDYDGKPVAAVEVCLTCGRIKMEASQEGTQNLYGIDINSVAEILANLKLSLHPYKSIAEYKESKKKLAQPKQ